MKIMYIDLETTGLNPESSLILEIGAVFDDLSKPLEAAPRFSVKIKHENLYGHPRAFIMNADLIAECEANGVDQLTAYAYFRDFLVQWSDRSTLNVGGKNFAGFDDRFLKHHMPELFNYVRFRHRVADPGMLCAEADDEVIPDLKTCLTRCGLDPNVEHRAMADCFAVAKIIRHRLLKG